MEFLSYTIAQLLEAYRSKRLSCSEVTTALLRHISSRDQDIHAYLSINERLSDAAKRADERMASGEPLRPLEGIPLAIKDNICTIGFPTTCASRILEHFISPYDATVVERLLAAGAIIVGKTNMDEFAFGSSTENSAFGVTRNPRDRGRVPGGSSGGSAAAVAAGFCFGALGSDTGGSIRQPAAFCGVTGLKPTYGRVSRYGLVAFASSLDQIGPLTKDVGDMCLLLSVISGKDRRDSTSVDRPVPDYPSFMRRDLKGVRVGVPKEYFIEGMDKEVEQKVREAIRRAGELGADVREITLPHSQYGIAVYYIIATAEASSNLARYDGVKYGHRSSEPAANAREMYFATRGEGFGDEVKRRVILGTHVLSAGYYDAYYGKAQKVRTLIMRDFQRVFDDVDVIMAPTTPELPFPVGEKKDDPLRMYLSDIFTVNVNLAGLPSVSIPAGTSAGGLPVGLQIIGPHFGEEKIIAAASALEIVLQ